ncbi:MAG: glycosyltransferase family 2 protein [Chloroflexota bacterium]
MLATTSIIIPTLNERDNIIPLVERIAKALHGYRYQLVFVDDSSRDGTAGVAKSLASDYPIKVLVRPNKKGLATAILDGIALADGEVIGVMDADLQHPPEVLPSLIKEYETGKDLVIASRYVPGGGCENWKLSRRIISKGAIALAHILLPPTRKIKDPVSGFFLFRRSLVKDLKFDPTGYKILLEMLMVAKPGNIAEVPFTFIVRRVGSSKMTLRQERDYLRHLLSLMRRSGELTRFIKFIMVGGSGVVVNEGFLFLFREFAHLSLPLASALSIELSILSNYNLNDLITFRDRRKPGLGSFLSRALRFNLVSLAGAGINWVTLLFLTNVLGVHYLVANLIGILLATLWNYIVNSWWTWH